MIYSKEKRKEYHLKNKKIDNENNRLYYINNKDKIREKVLSRKDEVKKVKNLWYIKNREKIKNEKIIKKYNITLEDYNNLLLKQDNCCAICKINVKDLKKSLNIDHDHITSKVRGLLCSNCNTGIGLFKDNKKILLEAINYLK